jgi:hypothetical protein
MKVIDISGQRTRNHNKKLQEEDVKKKKKKNTNWKKKTGVCKPTRGKTKWFILALPPLQVHLLPHP